MRIVKFFFVITALFLSFAVYAEESSAKKIAVYTEDNRSVSVTSDQPQFIIKLKSNPTTGYSWFLREYDNSLMTPVKHVFEAAKGKIVGAPGSDIWTFRVKLSGFVVPQQTIIRFVYARPWEGSDQSKQVVFRVTTIK